MWPGDALLFLFVLSGSGMHRGWVTLLDTLFGMCYTSEHPESRAAMSMPFCASIDIGHGSWVTLAMSVAGSRVKCSVQLQYRVRSEYYDLARPDRDVGADPPSFKGEGG